MVYDSLVQISCESVEWREKIFGAQSQVERKEKQANERKEGAKPSVRLVRFVDGFSDLIEEAAWNHKHDERANY